MVTIMWRGIVFLCSIPGVIGVPILGGSAHYLKWMQDNITNQIEATTQQAKKKEKKKTVSGRNKIMIQDGDVRVWLGVKSVFSYPTNNNKMNAKHR